MNGSAIDVMMLCKWPSLNGGEHSMLAVLELLSPQSGRAASQPVLPHPGEHPLPLVAGISSEETPDSGALVQGGRAAGEIPIFSYNQTDFVKDRVAVEVQFGKYAFVAYDLFVKHLAFYVGDRIDVGIEILPMKSLQAQMSSGVPYYEGEFYNVVRQGRGVPAVPLVLVGIEP